jgi:hypothetical protein
MSTGHETRGSNESPPCGTAGISVQHAKGPTLCRPSREWGPDRGETADGPFGLFVPECGLSTTRILAGWGGGRLAGLPGWAGEWAEAPEDQRTSTSSDLGDLDDARAYFLLPQPGRVLRPL